MKVAAHPAASGAQHAAGFSGSKGFMDFVQEGSEHIDKTFATFVEAFSGHKEVPEFHGTALDPESAELEDFLRMQPGRESEDAKASSPLATRTISVATEDDISSGTTENSSVSGEDEFAKSTSPKPPKRLRAAQSRLDDREDVKVIQKWLNEQPIVKGMVVSASNFSETEGEAFVKDILYSRPRAQIDAAVSLGFSPTGFDESKKYTQRACPVSGHLLKQLEDAEIPFGAVMLRPEYDIASAHFPEVVVVDSHLRDVGEGCLVAVPLNILWCGNHISWRKVRGCTSYCRRASWSRRPGLATWTSGTTASPIKS